ncbi:hypothetical protein IEO21_10663 [Rhodonia placenta]|uniref:Uncharacterized protein n=1 Tax=Rhodonia placenta TaxID=104341 RepID=A0A8H7NSB7_9APHY|nr:hypothetical protein IEO21_10663 [Postia placenta]
MRSMLMQPPGAGESEQLCQQSPSCAVHCHPFNLIVQ